MKSSYSRALLNFSFHLFITLSLLLVACGADATPQPASLQPNLTAQPKVTLTLEDKDHLTKLASEFGTYQKGTGAVAKMHDSLKVGVNKLQSRFEKIELPESVVTFLVAQKANKTMYLDALNTVGCRIGGKAVTLIKVGCITTPVLYKIEEKVVAFDRKLSPAVGSLNTFVSLYQKDEAPNILRGQAKETAQHLNSLNEEFIALYAEAEELKSLLLRLAESDYVKKLPGKIEVWLADLVDDAIGKYQKPLDNVIKQLSRAQEILKLA